MAKFNDTQVRNQFGRLPGDERSVVRFVQEAVEDDAKTAATGIVSYKDVVFVHIVIPGNKDLVIYDYATDRHKFRFPREWEAFEKGQRIDVEGTPLKMWPQISAGQVRTLANLNIHSVEQLAEVADGLIARVNMASLKHKAKAWLDAQAGQASIMKHQSEIERRDAEIAKMKEQLDRLTQMVVPSFDERKKTTRTSKE